MRDQMLEHPFSLTLPYAPRARGDTALFKAEVNRALHAFRASNNVLFPLTTLLNVTILVVPPSAGGKDLDNLARLILPAVNEVWQPPSDAVRTGAFAIDSDPRLGAWWEQRVKALPMEAKYAVTQYRAFELPRYPDDPKEGLVRLALGDGCAPIDLRGEIDEILGKWQDSL